jgi:hypothetical protein
MLEKWLMNGYKKLKSGKKQYILGLLVQDLEEINI